MSIGRPSTKWAVTTLMGVAMALFLFGCQPKAPVKDISAPPDLFTLAERDFRSGLYEQAIKGYQQYLREYPDSEWAIHAMYRMGESYVQMAQYSEAMPLFENIFVQYPQHRLAPGAGYSLLKMIALTGERTDFETVASEWIRKYSDHPLKGEVYSLLGQTLKEEGDLSGAVKAWVQALASPLASPKRVEELDQKILNLIAEADSKELQEMTAFIEGPPYAPPLYERLTMLYIADQKFEEARRAAMYLVESTPEQEWVSKGRVFLERIEESMSVRSGVVGCLLPLSGPFAIYGEEVLNGMKLGVGIIGEESADPPIELVIRDTAGDPYRAATQLEELVVKEKVIAVIGPLASKSAVAAAKKAEELGVPLITLTQKGGITKERPMVFRNFLTPTKEVESIIHVSMQEMGWNRFGILYPENPYGRFLMNMFWDHVEEGGGQITAVESYLPEETDFEVQIKKMVGLYYPRPEWVKEMLRELKALEAEMALEATGEPDGLGMDEVPKSQPASGTPSASGTQAVSGPIPGSDTIEEETELKPEGEEEEEDELDEEPIIDFDAVFIPDSYHQVALIAPQFPFNNAFDIRFLGTSLWLSDELIDQAGEYVQGAIFPAGFYPGAGTDHIKNFTEQYVDQFESDPGVLAATGYDTVRLLRHFISEKPVRSRAEFQSQLLSWGGFNGLTGLYTFDAQGEVTKDPLMLTVTGRRLKLLR